MSEPFVKNTPRLAAALALQAQAEVFPHTFPGEPDMAGLSPVDVGLATMIYRTAMRRWGTLTYILDQASSAPCATLYPGVQAALLTTAAQLVFMDGVPVYAAVDEGVKLARTLGDPRDAGRSAAYANAVLRKVATWVGDRSKVDGVWTPAADRIPVGLAEEGYLQLSQPILPPLEKLPTHLAAACSMPRPLVQAWIEKWGEAQATALCLQGLTQPPVIVAVEPELDRFSSPAFYAHETDGFVVWQGGNAQLPAFLAQHPARRVQDPTASRAIKATAGLSPKRILDYCAGRGTKTRQLAQLHPQAEIFATDLDDKRRAGLRQMAAGLPNVKVLEFAQVADEAQKASFDLVVLDAPCSNTGVLARRVEARWRFGPASLGEITQLQRKIVEQAKAWATPGGHVLYSTCSIESGENAKQSRRIGGVGGQIVDEHLTLPAHLGAAHVDGGYHALVKMSA